MKILGMDSSENIKKLKWHITGSWEDEVVGEETWKVCPEPETRGMLKAGWKRNKDHLS